MAKVKSRFTFRPVETRVKAKVRDNMAAAALFARGRAVDSLRRGDRSGRLYRHGGTAHRASAPGEPPATDTGRLQGAVGSTVRVRAKQVIGVIFARTNYARALELGTPRLAARPFLRPAILDHTRAILAILRQARGRRR